jgi:hypothetical protein
MSFGAQNIQIIDLDRVDISVEPWRWEFAIARREEIGRHFAGRQRERPTLWNGRVLLLNRYEIRDGMLHGSSFETDYANFLAWRDWSFPDAGVFNVFAAAALQAADGAYLVGEMERRTRKTSGPTVCSILAVISAANSSRRPASKSVRWKPSRAGPSSATVVFSRC